MLVPPDVVDLGGRRKNMPVKPCKKKGSKKTFWKIGSGKCMYSTKAAAERAYSGYRGKKFGRRR